RMLKDEQLDAHMTEITNELDAMVSEGVPLDEIAAKLNLKTVSLTGLNTQNAVQKLEATSISKASLPRIQEAAFTLDSDETSPLMDTASGDYALVQMLKITPHSIPALDTIKARVAKDATEAAQKKALQD